MNFRSLLSIFAALATVVLPAKAATLNFLFTMNGTGGTITGEIDGLATSGASTPTAVYIYSQPAGYTFTPTINLLATGSGFQYLNGYDTFTVTAGSITGADFAMFKLIDGNGDAQGYGFNVTYQGFTNANGIYEISNNQTQVMYSFNSGGVSGVTYTPVPEPRRTTALFILAGLGLLAVRKLRGQMAI